MKVIRRFVQGALMRARSHDSILSAVDDGQVFTLGTVWDGQLAPFLDSGVEMLRPLVNAFTSGNVLHAEEIGRVINLGKTWTDAFRQHLKDAALQSSVAAETEKRVDVGEVASAVENLRTELGVRDPNMRGVVDAIRAVRSAADKLRSARTSDSRPRGVMGYSKPIGNGSKPVTPTQVNAAASDLWRARSGAPTVDAPRLTARMTPEQINESNRRFWAAR